ncbi:Aste57867_22421 [Aphanomyces stellatus]|uniref:Aste57867_22421 protein n=1 Tax=Aphanomyces stellatus TaxID=120398 RepID=A0A485LKS4_9STRA|nr:hypothetical protein As57867_022351 [Aphanomyces stellatus]VFT99083.1 Aste57867_22421 [Aphanomyces stellatus]
MLAVIDWLQHVLAHLWAWIFGRPWSQLLSPNLPSAPTDPTITSTDLSNHDIMIVCVHGDVDSFCGDSSKSVHHESMHSNTGVACRRATPPPSLGNNDDIVTYIDDYLHWLDRPRRLSHPSLGSNQTDDGEARGTDARPKVTSSKPLQFSRIPRRMPRSPPPRMQQHRFNGPEHDTEVESHIAESAPDNQDERSHVPSKRGTPHPLKTKAKARMIPDIPVKRRPSPLPPSRLLRGRGAPRTATPPLR